MILSAAAFMLCFLCCGPKRHIPPLDLPETIEVPIVSDSTSSMAGEVLP